MPAQTKHPIKVQHVGARFIAPKPSQTPRRRFARLFYNLRHPIDAAWGWLSSVRTAILLITSIFDWLQFFTIFSSWYFLLLLSILSLSIVVCTLNRAPTIWQNFKHPVIQRSEKFYQNALERSQFAHPDPVAWTTTHLRNRHYRVRSVQGTGDPGGRPGSPAVQGTGDPGGR